MKSKIHHHHFRLGIREKLLFTLVLVLVVSFSIDGLLTINQKKTQLLNQQQYQAQSIAHYVSRSLSLQPMVSFDSRVQNLMAEMVSRESVSYAAVYDHQGRLVAQAGEAVKLGEARQVSTALVLNNRTTGVLILQLPDTPVQQALAELKKNVLWSSLFKSALIMLGAYLLLTFFVVRPLQEIRHTLIENEDSVLDDFSDEPDDFGQIVQQFRSLRRIHNRTKTNLSHQLQHADARIEQSQYQLAQRDEQLKQLKASLDQSAHLDPLTGIFNRHYFDQHLEDMGPTLGNGGHHALLLFEIDQFKSINDNQGYKTGNEILMGFSQLLSAHKAQSDLLFRVGGKTFALLCPQLSAEKALVLANYIRNKFSTSLPGGPYPKNTQAVPVTLSLSIGVAVSPGQYNCDTGEELYRCAEVALDYSKEHGGNRCSQFDSVMQQIKGRSTPWIQSVENQTAV